MPEGSVDLGYAKKGGAYVPNKGGVTTWFNREIYSTKLTGQQIGLVEARCRRAAVSRSHVPATRNGDASPFHPPIMRLTEQGGSLNRQLLQHNTGL